MIGNSSPLFAIDTTLSDVVGPSRRFVPGFKIVTVGSFEITDLLAETYSLETHPEILELLSKETFSQSPSVSLITRVSFSYILLITLLFKLGPSLRLREFVLT